MSLFLPLPFTHPLSRVLIKQLTAFCGGKKKRKIKKEWSTREKENPCRVGSAVECMSSVSDELWEQWGAWGNARLLFYVMAKFSVSPGSCDVLWQGTACSHLLRAKGLRGKQSQAGPFLLPRDGAEVLEQGGESLSQPPAAVNSSKFCLALFRPVPPTPTSGSVLKD